MKLSDTPFTDLRRLLLKLGFAEMPTERGHRFEHQASNTVLLFRPYQRDDLVTEIDLAGTRRQLDWRGLLPAEVFDDRLHKTPA
jgi:hypothetical protein